MQCRMSECRMPECWMSEWYWPGGSHDNAALMLDAWRDVCTQLGGAVVVLDATWLPDDETFTARWLGTRSLVMTAHELTHARLDRLTRAEPLTELTGEAK